MQVLERVLAAGSDAPKLWRTPQEDGLRILDERWPFILKCMESGGEPDGLVMCPELCELAGLRYAHHDSDPYTSPKTAMLQVVAAVLRWRFASQTHKDAPLSLLKFVYNTIARSRIAHCIDTPPPMRA